MFSFVPSRRSENKEIVNIFKIITLFTKYRLNSSYFNPIRDVIWFRRMTGYGTVSNKISFLEQKTIFLIYFVPETGGDTRLHHDFESEERFQEMADIFTLSITEPDLSYHKGLPFHWFLQIGSKTILEWGKFNSRDESKKKYLLVSTSYFFMKRMNPFIEGSEKNGSGLLREWLEDPKTK